MKGKLIIGFLMICLSILLPVILSAEQQPVNQEIDIIFLNLPNGEATLIRTETGENVLINTGAPSSYQNLLHQLEGLKVNKIDQLILTSFKKEYAGNTEAIMEKFHVSKFLFPGNYPKDQTEFPEDSVFAYWPKIKNTSLSENVKIKFIDENADDEATFLLQYGKESVLFLNDKEISFEEKLYASMQQIDIIKIAAFGSGESPSQQLLRHLDPYLGIIFYSPSFDINEDLVERLFASWIDAYFLKQTGSIYIRLTKEDYEIMS
ncbi:Metal-dependent hydrolase, beta-lactamase superfamily II [Gracilibacillus ureilyticus]|uniref:Metal-dependent hydrolase, beta-lactamase superfamily II n=1 Tax=Gracilibacillus ureilyticus TaxID=531814 RepID=A0A1H9LM35_9BACI|nr:hypothetical protein [Gracilibacillus ureilyticus]SER12572.1 Metal-dependent hydrolase, beta-lactamase superfamily II [Gracilibacillus ureilyticus]